VQTLVRWPVRWVAAVCCALLLAGCESTAPTDVEAPTAPGSSTIGAVIDLTNQERTRQGLAPLSSDERLARAAQLQVEQMIRHGRLEHVLPEAQYPRPEDRLAAAGYGWQAYGENLAFGYADARAAVQGWMESPSHRANILGTSFTQIGVGQGRDENGRPYYAQVFGRPR
jgi:uncharacterized protein YkwD